MDIERIGRFITELRQAKGMTQKDLASRLRVSDKTISRWETGKVLPDPSSWLALGEVLDIGVNELLTGRRIGELPRAREVDEAVTDATLYFASRNRPTLVSVLMGIGLLLHSIAAVVQLFPQPLSPGEDIAYGPYLTLWRILPLLGLAGLFLIGAGVAIRSEKSGMRLAVGSALYFGYMLAGLGSSLDLLSNLLKGTYTSPLFFGEILSYFVQPFLTLLAFALLLVIGIGGARRWLSWTTAASVLLMMATWVQVVLRSWPHMNYILKMHPIGGGWEMATFLGHGFGILFVGAALVPYLLRSIRRLA